MRAFKTVLSTAFVPRLMASMLLGRLPTGMAALAIVLAVRAEDGSYTTAGVLAGVYAVSQAVGAPVLARAVDMRRQPPVLLGGAFVSGVGFCSFALLDVTNHPLPAGLAVAAAGFATPPLEPCLRVLWSDLLAEEHVPAAYSLDTAIQELIFTAGPLTVLGAVAMYGPNAGSVAAACTCLVGTVVFASSRPSRHWRGVQARRHWAGPLRSMPLVRLLFAVTCVGATIGTFTVAITAHAESVATRPAAGWLLAANAVGALAGGIANTMGSRSHDPSRRLFWLMMLLALGYLPLVVAPGMWGTAPLAFVSGLALPPVLATAMVLVDVLAPKGTVTEAFAWVVTAFGCGFAGGSAVAGVALDRSGYALAMSVAAVAGVAGAALVRVRLTSPAVAGTKL